MIWKTLLIGIVAVSAALAATADSSLAPAYYKDVLPVLQSKCQGCHRPGEIGPMSLLTYQSTRPWAAAIKEAVLTRKMPPWPADPHVGHFANVNSLTDAQRATLVSWVDQGAPEGNPSDAPPPMHWVEGWGAGKPDLVIQMPKPYHVPKGGVVEYTYVIIPTHFQHDMWVRAAEIVPSNRAVVHHIIAFLRTPGSKWFAGQPIGEFFVPSGGRGEDGASEFLVGYAPGLPATVLPDGAAKLIPAGSDIVLQLHYTPNGKSTDDQSKLGLYFSGKPQRREMTLSAANHDFTIPAGDPDYQVESSFTLRHEATLVGMMPHMHLRGKDFKYTIRYSDGHSEELLSVPRWDFRWQMYYKLADQMQLPAGTRIECVAHYDNSPNNPDNPDPSKVVHWGDQTFDEMMIGFFDVNFPVDLNPMELFRPPQPARASD
jgi:hypothetical protein